MATRIRRAIFTLLVALSLAAGLQAATAAPASAQEQVDIGVFYDSLAPYGHWFQDPRFGWAWYPTSVEPGWRPYTHGHWLWTDEYGWYWNSDYEWGWAPFHYGRWAFSDTYGWIWVPGTVWGPAWVAWRSGDGYVGWAPMPPEAVWQDGGFGRSSFNVDFAPAWTFCDERFLADPRPVFVPVQRNETFISRTTNVTNFVTINNRIVDRSIDPRRIEAAAHTRITPVHVRDVDRPELTGGRQAAGGEVHVFRPKVAARPQEQPGAQPGTQGPARVPEPVMRNPQNLETQKQQREIEQQKQQREVEEQKQQRAVEEQKQQRAIEQQKQQRAVEEQKQQRAIEQQKQQRAIEEQQRAIEQQKQQRAVEQQQQQRQPQPTKHQEEQQKKQQLRRQQQCQENPSSC